MRYLTLTRLSEAATRDAVLNVYVEDPSANDAIINKKQCRIIGFIRDGEQKVFTLSDDSANIYVTEKKQAFILETEYYTLPAGPINVTLSGSYKARKISGKNFEFNGASQKVLKARSSARSAGAFATLFAILFVAATLLVGIRFLFITLNHDPMFPAAEEEKDEDSDTEDSNSSVSKKPAKQTTVVQTSEPEITEDPNAEAFDYYPFSITLTKDFTPSISEGLFLLLESNEITIWVNEVPLSDLKTDFQSYTAEDYCHYYLESTQIKYYDHGEFGDLHYAHYYVEYTDATLVHYQFFARTADSFWRINFFALEDFEYVLEENIDDWAGSIVIY